MQFFFNRSSDQVQRIALTRIKSGTRQTNRNWNDVLLNNEGCESSALKASSQRVTAGHSGSQRHRCGISRAWRYLRFISRGPPGRERVAYMWPSYVCFHTKFYFNTKSLRLREGIARKVYLFHASVAYSRLSDRGWHIRVARENMPPERVI